ncbi:sensor domain-containing diguanylate cyclase [Pseudomonas sp. Choline-3u-10]|jgi:diguanylate cyclase (GGDEF)-like protein|uniref:sensor domain-containing diguanylate cyclase n=1 Tax=Pseudomonadaceae TaxID=135621 RepID=UPI00061822F8|nr:MULTISPECIES: sensor domain-containing diguanylate cyclase [Pseudomonadaceae]MAL34757.1 sensor domain-containing diguanylate cyclase [Pseudomonas sp.]MBU0948589.1 GGDEF domain-containing protein [Gammaproteobacteria bacterium]KJJ65028.1 diguanylate cyclase [Pseudomonas sp. 10B238]MBK3795789.1 diguanylate cyclase [Stutzerimonas stutzeri]MBK3877856.1 diguanylate cyclase [Stutzerimonas stutzeri]
MPDSNDLSELHWLLAIVQSIDVGVVVLDREYRIDVWNTFMENRSGRLPEEARKKTFFELFPEVDEQWFRRKVENVATLGTPSFTIWEQRPYLLRFKNYQPITGLEDFMYQNTTLMPLKALNGSIEQVCLIIYDVTDVATNRRQLQAANQELQRLSSTDRLTGLFNRGHWEEMLRQDYARHRRYERNAALVMFDIDHFKKINDSYGHQAGDAVIQQTAELVRQSTRDADIAGRYGGEEFVVLLPDTDSEGALTFAERLRQSIEAHEVVHEGRSIRFTVSLGIADLSEPTNGYAQLIERADIALYSSKASGRNQVTLYR